MTISVNWPAKIVLSDASITDIVAFKDTIRDLEDDDEGVLYPPIITYKRVDLGGGAYFHAVDAINGYQLEFVGAGPFQITGNINIPIIDTGVQVERKTSAAFATTAVGGTGPSAESIAAAVLSALNATTIPVDVQKMNSAGVIGDGSVADPWRGVGVVP